MIQHGELDGGGDDTLEAMLEIPEIPEIPEVPEIPEIPENLDDMGIPENIDNNGVIEAGDDNSDDGLLITECGAQVYLDPHYQLTVQTEIRKSSSSGSNFDTADESYSSPADKTIVSTPTTILSTPTEDNVTSIADVFMFTPSDPSIQVFDQEQQVRPLHTSTPNLRTTRDLEQEPILDDHDYDQVFEPESVLRGAEAPALPTLPLPIPDPSSNTFRELRHLSSHNREGLKEVTIDYLPPKRLKRRKDPDM